MKRIIYPTPEGGVAILIPTVECGLTIEAIALKDVPAGVPFQIVDVTDIPSDRTFRAAWEADITNPDGTGANYGAGSSNEVIGWNEDGSPIVKEVTE